jgi:hypothetical protein
MTKYPGERSIATSLLGGWVRVRVTESEESVYRFLREDVEIMAVEMNGEGNSLRSLDDKVDPFVCGVELDDVGRGGEVCVVFVDLE